MNGINKHFNLIQTNIKLSLLSSFVSFSARAQQGTVITSTQVEASKEKGILSSKVKSLVGATVFGTVSLLSNNGEAAVVALPPIEVLTDNSSSSGTFVISLDPNEDIDTIFSLTFNLQISGSTLMDVTNSSNGGSLTAEFSTPISLTMGSNVYSYNIDVDDRNFVSFGETVSFGHSSEQLDSISITYDNQALRAILSNGGEVSYTLAVGETDLSAAIEFSQLIGGPVTYSPVTSNISFTGDTSVSLIPEPSTVALLSLGLAAATLRRKRDTK